jgi:glycerol-3-phosphate dehydrogenase
MLPEAIPEVALPREWSATTRAEVVQKQERDVFDLLVVGGGITGAAIAWDAALRGLRCALVEMGDVAQGTSSRSSRLVHGGLRYLEQLKLGLVFEGTHERRILMDLAPHQVRPLPFLMPLYRGDRHGPNLIATGLLLYELLSLGRGIGWFARLDPGEVRVAEPGVRADGLLGAVRYFDCATDDARLTLTLLRSAAEAGAQVASRVRFEKPLHDEGLVCGAQVRDLLADRSYSIKARAIVNAAGPWTDHVLSAFPGEHRAMLRPTKGIHVVLPAARLPVKHAVVMAAADARVTFCIPWGECTYVGTTDTDHLEAPEDACARPSDVEYLLATVARYFPAANLTVEDVQGTWAGLRPLVSQEKGSPYDVSREHTIVEHPGGAFTIAGGKLTTCRKMACDVLDRVIVWFRSRGDQRAFLPCSTKTQRLAGTEGLTPATLDARRRELETAFGLPTPVAAHFQRAWGSDAMAILKECEKTTNGLDPLVPGLPYLWGEIEASVRHEMVLSLEDLLVRRTHVFYKASDQGEAVEGRVAGELARLLGWDAARSEQELQWYRRRRMESRAFRAR